MLSSQEEYERRLEICNACQYKMGVKFPICQLCGCFLKIKARLVNFGCPIEKWANSGEIPNTTFLSANSSEIMINGGSCGQN